MKDLFEMLGLLAGLIVAAIGAMLFYVGIVALFMLAIFAPVILIVWLVIGAF